MASSPLLEMNTNLPGVRLLQQWIREKQELRIQLVDGSALEGYLQWQDPEFLALIAEGKGLPELLSRSHVVRITAINQNDGLEQGTILSSRPCLPQTN
jgi:host factor-I protein